MSYFYDFSSIFTQIIFTKIDLSKIDFSKNVLYN